MSERVAIFVPTVGRPTRVAEVAENLRSATAEDYRLIFIVEKHDAETIEAVGQIGAELIINPGPPTYASCMNTAYAQTDEPFFFTGADDAYFRPGWLTAALKCMADPSIGIVGTRDPLHDWCDHSTHSLVRRKYIDEQSGCLDRPRTFFYAYLHGWAEHELLGVAKVRGAYHYCEESEVEHRHPGWDWQGRVRSDDEKYDATYAKGNRNHNADTAIFLQRSAQWIDLLPDNSQANRDIKKFVRQNRGVRGKIRYCAKLFKVRVKAVRQLLGAMRQEEVTAE